MPTPTLSGRLSVIPGTKLAILESGHIGAPDALIFVGAVDKLFRVYDIDRCPIQDILLPNVIVCA